ncbi:hypothetical protein FCV25MIE_26294 [Fagus crenata]
MFNNVSYLESSKDIWDTCASHVFLGKILLEFMSFIKIFSLQQGDRSIEEYFSPQKSGYLIFGVKDERSALVGHYHTPRGVVIIALAGTHNGRGGRGWSSGGGGP